MHWLLLVIAGLLEVVWAVGLKSVDGFRKPLTLLVVASAIAGSMILLGLAMRAIPVGTAYAIWVGIGALGAATGGMLLYHETMTLPRLFFLALLVISIIGLKVTSGA